MDHAKEERSLSLYSNKNETHGSFSYMFTMRTFLNIKHAPLMELVEEYFIVQLGIVAFFQNVLLVVGTKGCGVCRLVHANEWGRSRPVGDVVPRHIGQPLWMSFRFHAYGVVFDVIEV